MRHLLGQTLKLSNMIRTTFGHSLTPWTCLGPTYGHSPRILFPGCDADQTSSIANRGHFVVYTTDGTRFTIPLEYLSTGVFRELFRISEEEFGLPTDGPITFPCDSAFLEYVMPLLKKCIPEDLEKALLTHLQAYINI